MNSKFTAVTVGDKYLVTSDFYTLTLDAGYGDVHELLFDTREDAQKVCDILNALSG